jgi:hypothetical protein
MKDMSDQAIADEAGVSRFMVQAARQVALNATCNQPPDTTKQSVHSDGRKQATTRAGRQAKSADAKRIGVDGKTYRCYSSPTASG